MNIVKLHKIKGNLNATGVSHRFYRVPCFALKEKIGISVEICGCRNKNMVSYGATV